MMSFLRLARPLLNNRLTTIGGGIRTSAAPAPIELHRIEDKKLIGGNVEVLTEGLNALNGIVWGVPMLVLILGTGLFLQIRLKMMPIAKIGYGIKLVWQGRKSGSAEDGEISPFAALMTALAATVGTGNIAGVATAIALGGPGALFWMWCTALVGMATKYAEVLLAVHYREVDENGEHVGGPMYAIKNGLGPNWRWLGTAFAL